MRTLTVEQAKNLRRRRGFQESAFKWLTLGAVVIGILLLIALLYGVIRDGASRLNWSFISSFPSRFPGKAGIKAALMGSLWVIGLTFIIAVPCGVAAAVYLEEYGKKNRFASFLQLNIANLAGVPSIVYGLLGLAVFVRLFGFERSILAGACTMALLILPTVIITTQEALRAVPSSLREGSLALGATPWQTIARQILPMALPGIMTGVILSIARAAGETAPLVVIGAVTFIAETPNSARDSFTTLPNQIFNWTSRPEKEFQQNAAAGIMVLLLVLFAMNLIAIILRNRFERNRAG
jgi:phosphate transport system permease protein